MKNIRQDLDAVVIICEKCGTKQPLFRDPQMAEAVHEADRKQ